MTHIYLIRHAEAEGNLYRLCQGQYDGHVTARGRLQIAALAERFRGINLDALYSSDLSRTVETAGAITKYHSVELHATPRLREIAVGAWECRPWGELAWEQPEEMELFSTDPARWRAEGAETFAALTARIRAAILDIAKKEDGRTVAAVSHGMAIRSLMCAALGVASADIHRVPHGDNTCVALLHVEGESMAVEYYNDASHLEKDALSTFAGQSWWRRGARQDGTDLRYVPLNPALDRALYISCYAAAWEASHGTLAGFEGERYFAHAVSHLARDRRAVLKAYAGERFAGMVDMDTARDAESGAGWISLCCLAEGFRGRGMGVQLIGCAASEYRARGRSRLLLHTAEENLPAIRFYRRWGFETAGCDRGALGKLWVMELPLGEPEGVKP